MRTNWRCMRLNEKKIYVLETNVDDATGEVMGHALGEIEKVAVDAFIETGYGKKGRPVFILKALAHENDVEKVAEAMMRETGSLGVRVIECTRHIMSRTLEEKTVNILGKKYCVMVKKTKHTKKPEYEELKKISEKTGMPLRQVKQEVEKQID